MRTVLSYVASQPSPAPKVSKRKATLQSATPAGQTCGGAFAGCVVELALRCARRSDNHGESDDEACARRRACHPANAPPQAQPEGGGQPNSPTAQQPHGPLLRSAPMGAGALRRAAPGRAQRWPVWLLGATPPSGCACGAQGMADQGSRLSEGRRREFERDPASTEHRRLPGAKRRDADSRVAFLLLTFLWRSKEK